MKGVLFVFFIQLTHFSYSQGKELRPDTGVASYYAKKFEGRKTASGEIFHNDSLTAAHKTFAFGTYVRVTNIKNQKSVVVRINDRGMRGHKRIIDLSEAAARKIGMIGSGLVSVEVQQIK
jgi:rare lipoprotein A